jgi:hypothetical protein
VAREATRHNGETGGSSAPEAEAKKEARS